MLFKSLFPALAALALQIVISSPAQAFCFSPNFYERAPSAPMSLSRPLVPNCLSGIGYSEKSTCDPYVLSTYTRQTNQYVAELEQYAQQAIGFAGAAVKYAEDAKDFADCEAREAKSKLK